MRKFNLLAIALVFATNTAQAGLFGDIVGAAIIHHENEVQSRKNVEKGVAVGIAGTVAAQEAEHGIIKHPVIAAGLVGGGALVYMEAHHCHKTGLSGSGVPLWACDNVDGSHPLDVEMADTIMLAKTARLEKAMKAAGDPRPGKGCAAHHIVMAEDGRFSASGEARNILESCGIDIDSAENGVWLPQRRNVSACRGAYHPKLHTVNYAKNILLRLRKAKFENGCSGVQKELLNIKQELLSTKG